MLSFLWWGHRPNVTAGWVQAEWGRQQSEEARPWKGVNGQRCRTAGSGAVDTRDQRGLERQFVGILSGRHFSSWNERRYDLELLPTHLSLLPLAGPQHFGRCLEEPWADIDPREAAEPPCLPGALGRLWHLASHVGPVHGLLLISPVYVQPH